MHLHDHESRPEASAIRSTWHWWINLVLKNKGYLGGAIFFLLIFLFGEALLPWIVGWVIDEILRDDVVAAGVVQFPLIGAISPNSALWITLAVTGSLIIIRNFAQYWRDAFFNEVGELVHLDLRQRLFDHLQTLPMSFFDRSYTGRIMARITTDADALYHLLCNGTVNILGHGLLIVVMSVSLFHVHAGLSLALFACAPILLFLVMYTRKHAKAAGRSRNDAIGAVFGRLQERIAGIRVIRSFGRSKEESEAFKKDLRELQTYNRQLVRGYARMGALSNGCTRLTGVIILCFGGIAAVNGELSIGKLVTFYLSSAVVLMPLSQMAASITQHVTDASVAIERIAALLHADQQRAENEGKIICPNLQGKLSINNVSFSYLPGQRVIHDLSLEAEPGKCIALVGPSGGGKSTLVDLLCRFYSIESGIIKVDNTNIYDLHADSFRQQIGYVSQETFLFHGTIADNLRIANAEANIDQLRDACEKANALEFIEDLANGFDTTVGERGVTLSGGQRQRLGIARTLLSNPKLLILDEPTSALDAESEAIVMDAIKRCFAGRTCIIIAHRLATVRHADQIYVIKDGRIQEQGTHDELVKHKGVYKELASKQGLAA